MLNTKQYDAIEERVRAAGYSMRQFLKLAELNASTWYRWKAGDYGPTMKNWGRVKATVAELEAANE